MNKAFRRVALIVVVIFAVVKLPPLFLRERPSCPNHNYPVRAAHDTFSIVPLAGEITDIPEFHDCQRLLTPDVRAKKLSYGPLVGIWVSESLEVRLRQLADKNPKPGPGGTSPLSVIALAFVQLYSWDGAYPDLGIGMRWNCLYLYPNPDMDSLGAKMVQVSKREACLEPQPLTALIGDTVTSLLVTRDKVVGLGDADYPAVGRWDWDPKNNRQYIGLKCGGAWCEVGSLQGLNPSARYGDGGAAGAGDRVVAVKGWYDEQSLAVLKPRWIPNWFAGFLPWLVSVEPAQFTGTIVPDPELDRKEEGAFTDVWVSAGYVVLSASHPKYHNDFNYGPGVMPSAAAAGKIAKVWICHGTNCDGELPACHWDNPDEQNWWARVEYDGTVKYRCIKHVDHSGEGRSIPGTARWFWEAKDEKSWYRCGAGCCTVE